jgi:hypothetical protein
MTSPHDDKKGPWSPTGRLHPEIAAFLLLMHARPTAARGTGLRKIEGEEGACSLYHV